LKKTYLDETIAICHKELLSDKNNYRHQSYRFLRAENAIDAKPESLYHIQNFFTLSSSSQEWKDSTDWLSQAAEQNNWASLKQGIDLISFGVPKFYRMYGNEEQGVELIIKAFFPEMKSILIEWTREHENLNQRFLAYEVLAKAELLEMVDLWSFHKTTLTNFSCAYLKPRDFAVALDYCKSHINGSHQAEIVKTLEASKTYVASYLDYFEKQNKSSFSNAKNNIIAIEDTLKLAK
jgi:hypothetical protein